MRKILRVLIIVFGLPLWLYSCSETSSTPEQEPQASAEQNAGAISYNSTPLKQMEISEALEILQSPPDEQNAEKLYVAIRSIGVEKGAMGVEPLIKVFGGKNPVAKVLAAISLGQIEDSRAVPSLMKVAASTDMGLRYHAVQSLGQIGDSQANSLLEQIAQNDPIPRVRQMAEVSLRAIREREFQK